MLIKYMLIFFLCIAAVLLAFYILSDKEIKSLAENNALAVSRERQRFVSANLAANDDIFAAILIMPKSFWPDLKRFSQSKIAKNVKILPAQIQLKDDEMVAVPKRVNQKHGDRRIEPGEDFSNKATKSGEVISPEKKERILTISFLYLLANISKSRLYR